MIGDSVRAADTKYKRRSNEMGRQPTRTLAKESGPRSKLGQPCHGRTKGMCLVLRILVEQCVLTLAWMPPSPLPSRARMSSLLIWCY